MTWLFAVLLFQDPSAQADQVRAAMAASVEKQLASVRLQTHSQGSTSTISLGPPAGADCSPVPKPEFESMINEVSHTQQVDAAIIREVVRQESGMRPCAVSPKGAEGLMQLMPATQAQLQVQNPFNAKESLEAGTKLLKQLLDRYHGDLSLALSAYNAGSGTVDRSGGVPNIPETKNYVAAILAHLLRVP
jgi:soluble lytic murein transglycosylase-like protein